MDIRPNQQQFVNFPIYKLDPAWRRLPEHERAQGKKEFLEAYQSFQDKMILLSYSLVGIRADADFMMWRVSYDLEDFEQIASRLSNTGLGKYLNLTYNYLSMTRRSVYVEDHQHDGQEGNRLFIVPGQSKYIFVYPFIKNRPWYGLSKEIRGRAMKEHIETGHKYQSVKINTTYSFGLDDQEFVLAFESDKPGDFVDLMMELRETEASAYTVKDTPTFTGLLHPLPEILDLLDNTPALTAAATR